MPTLYKCPTGSLSESTLKFLYHPDLTALLQRISAPPELAILPFEASHLLSTVHLQHAPDAGNRANSRAASYDVHITLSLPTPFGPFSFTSRSATLQEHLISDFLTAQVYATLIYLSLFERITTLCSQFALIPVPYSSPLRPTAAPPECSWIVPGVLRLDWQRYALSLHVSFQQDQNYLESVDHYPPTMDHPNLVPSQSPTWNHYSTQVLPPFLAKLANHLQTAQLLQLTC